MRVKKTVDGVTTTYHMAGRVIAGETTDGQTIWYNYDTQSQLISIVYNHEDYFYVRNAQGDILALIDKVGNKVVEYKYDSWGAIVDVSGSMAGSLGKKNPFRYRGYYYDEETGLYYISSRYYSAENLRFLSTDKLEIIAGTVEQLENKNLYIYCNNNPVVKFDYNGEFGFFTGLVVGALVGMVGQYIGDVATNIISGQSGLEALKPSSSLVEYGAAAISGALATTGITTKISTIANGAIAAGSYLLETEKKDINVLDLTLSTGIGALAGYRGKEGMQLSKNIGIIRTSKRKINTLKSAKKIRLYTTKRIVAKNRIYGGIRTTIRVTVEANVENYVIVGPQYYVV